MPEFIPAGLIFDCDGTLADTMPLHWRAWSELASRHSLDFPETRFYGLGGVPTRDILKLLAQEQNRPDIDPLALAREKEELYLHFLPEVGPVEEVVAIAREHRGRIPMAVASGGSRHAIRRIRVEPTRCRAFEDTNLGMQAIRAAGMDAVDIRCMRTGLPPAALG